MQRRKFLSVVGTGAVVLAAASASAFVATRSPRKALEPWQVSGLEYPDSMRRALSYAILAPNPHNRQPWQVDLLSDREAVLYCDLNRLLPETDPYDRQIVIGLGCFLELFDLAAREQGQRAQISLFPQGEPRNRLDHRPIAVLKLIEEGSIDRDPLFQQVLHRRTNRNPFDMARAVSESRLDSVLENLHQDVIAGHTNGGQPRQRLRALTRDALRDEILDPPAFQESVDLMRIGKAEIEANPDGIYLGGAFLETLALAGVLNRQALSDPASSSFQIGLDMADEQALTSMAFLWINTRGNGRLQQIAAGRSYLRAALTVTSLGLSMQPMSQALQEYAAMRPHYDRVHRWLTSEQDERVQMLARLGYAEAVDAAPRWSLDSRINRV